MTHGDDLLCPECHHSLGLHKYFYGTCDAPLGGMFVRSRCECPVTLYELFKKLQKDDVTKKLEELQIRHDICVNEMTQARTVLIEAQGRLQFLSIKLAVVTELINEAKLVETNRFANAYKIKIQEIFDRILDIIIEEKPNDNTN